jgi:putative FmdB family regulatory protein
MPTYDYTCVACKKTFEIFHSMTEAAKKKCPGCGKSALERQLGTGGAIIFKGSGFYQTDYRSEGYKKSADADKPANGESKPGETKSGETKATETKAESKPAAQVQSNGESASMSEKLSASTRAPTKPAAADKPKAQPSSKPTSRASGKANS